MGELGRRVPSDWTHVERYPFTLTAGPELVVERTIGLPWWHWSHDQGREGSCVGHGAAMERAITNRRQRMSEILSPVTRRYDPIDLWDQAKLADEWPDTNPGDDEGTSVRAAYEVLRVRGPRMVRSVKLLDGRPVSSGMGEPDLAEGVSEYRWATDVDGMRRAIHEGLPVTIGVNWYRGFDGDSLIQRGSAWWIGDILGSLRGGHCVCLYGASDRKQAFKLKNSWGRSYPLVWLPYGTMAALLADDGEAALVSDR